MSSFFIRCVVQRVRQCEIIIEEKSRGICSHGLLLYFGLGTVGDLKDLPSEPTPDLQKKIDSCAEKLLSKLTQLRIFQDELGKMNKSVCDIQGGIYIVSQFTLFADIRKGNRPSFTQALPSSLARSLFQSVEQQWRKNSTVPLFSGEFAADMKVRYENDGPITITFEMDDLGNIS